MDSIEHNRQAWDQRVRDGQRFTRPATPMELREAAKNIDPWVSAEGVHHKTVLCLGAGGGRQGPLYAAAGGLVTVVDVSVQQLEIDRRVAHQAKLNLITVAASMDDLSQLVAGSFDIVVHPVSTCYLPDIVRVYEQVARVLKIGGLYVSQHKQPTSLQADIRRSKHGYEITEPYYRQGPLPDVNGSPHRESGTLEYLHRWEQLIGGMCRSGFVIEDLAEPKHADPAAKMGSFGDRSQFIAPYVRIKARRVEQPERTDRTPTITLA